MSGRNETAHAVRTHGPEDIIENGTPKCTPPYNANRPPFADVRLWGASGPHPAAVIVEKGGRGILFANCASHAAAKSLADALTHMGVQAAPIGCSFPYRPGSVVSDYVQQVAGTR